MVIESVRVHMLSNRHVVILKDTAGDRYLPIWIGAWEASAIAMRLQGLRRSARSRTTCSSPRWSELGVRVVRVVISELADETYHARLHLERDGVEVEVDSRPSDALALAVRAGVRIFADEEVLAQAALATDPDDEVTGEDEPDDEPGSEGAERPRRRRPPIESIGDAPADPRLDMFRDFVNSLERDQGGGPESGERLTDRGEAGWPATSDVLPARTAIGVAAARGPCAGRAHSRRRSAQKSRTARNTTCGLAPVGLPAVRG